LRGYAIIAVKRMTKDIKKMRGGPHPRRSESYKGSRKYGDSSLGPPPLIFFIQLAP
jgi:hypothetical protein